MNNFLSIDFVQLAPLSKIAKKSPKCSLPLSLEKYWTLQVKFCSEMALGSRKKINLSKCFTFLTTNIQSWTVFEFPWKHFFLPKFFFREIITLYQYRSKLSWRSTYLSDYKHGENENYTNTAWIFTHQFCIPKTNNRKKFRQIIFSGHMWWKLANFSSI